MKKLIAGIGAALISSSLPVAAADNEGWVVVGYSRKTGDPSTWIKLRNAEQINEDSFKFYRRRDGFESLVKLNCKNKDISFGRGYQQIPDGTGWSAMGDLLCRFIPQRVKWGMTSANAYLWNATPPKGSPADSTGDWVEVISNERNEEYYSDDVISDGRAVIFARYTRDKQTDTGERTRRDSEVYRWIIADCSSARFYTWRPTGERFFKGFWRSPGSARPRSSVRAVTKKYCGTPNVKEIGVLPIPTVEDLREYAD